MGVENFFNPHGDADFDPEPDPEPRSYFDDPEPDPESGSYFDDPNPNSEFVSNSDPDPNFDSDLDFNSGSNPDMDSYKTYILCIFHCTDYDFPTNDLDTLTRLSILR
ncbi:hypothetical protein L3X38_022514 [Prunus dulcis]|uniref:Uncharacterized protein n=1 Tax=Prunus dulcis TaxID=3755 RepID=A0AAD4VW52_PRUDU|nr:hypothetical protein L3X38_022514 [Prunus dulcis]